MASLDKKQSIDSKGNAAHVEDAAHIEDSSRVFTSDSNEKKDLGALEAQTPEAQNEVS
jgi:hypothetical protein